MPKEFQNEIKTCCVLNCNGIYKAKGYCNKHWYQMYRHGKILHRTRFDPNEFIQINKNTTEIIVYNKLNNPTTKTLVDNNIVGLLKGYKWCLGPRGYICT